ncbi:hypothetical protein GG851_10385 [Bordetella petrii]|nr:hypothetical protein [Bordetella petrii]
MNTRVFDRHRHVKRHTAAGLPPGRAEASMTSLIPAGLVSPIPKTFC